MGHPRGVPIPTNVILGEVLNPERVDPESENSPSVSQIISSFGVDP